MTKMNIDTCNCCDEIWANCNMKHIQLGKHVLNLCPDCYAEYIKSFKQEPILDKIRAEIEQLRNFSAENYDLEQYCDYFDARIIFRDDVLQIIDKYRGEVDCHSCKTEYDCYECEKYAESEEKDAT